MEITIYVDGRHPKDIMRSFSHELVHHNQNENGEFANIVGQGGSNYAQTNPHLRKMEKRSLFKRQHVLSRLGGWLQIFQSKHFK